ncbi:TPA: hypothetical protein HA244_03740 [Candidatus Micrarchaeota archaeon]|nr:hypothetical protein [Candidatus Micrarchaeota archaeon]
MAFLGLDVETAGFLFILIFSILAFSSGSWNTGIDFVSGLALVYEIPVQLFIVGVGNSAPLLLPLGILAFLYFAQSLDKWVGVGFGTLAFLAWVVMALGV